MCLLKDDWLSSFTPFQILNSVKALCCELGLLKSSNPLHPTPKSVNKLTLNQPTKKTRKHSSRVRTAHLPTISPGIPGPMAKGGWVSTALPGPMSGYPSPLGHTHPQTTISWTYPSPRHGSCTPVFRWFKFTLKPPYSIVHDKLRLAIWDTSFWTFLLKFGHKGP